MPIDFELYNKPAVRGDVSGTTITIAVALFEIAGALQDIRDGKLPSAEAIKKISETGSELNEIFDRLTGYDSND